MVDHQPLADHRPIVSIFDMYMLDAVKNLRLQRTKMCMAPYQFVTIWRASQDHVLVPVLMPQTRPGHWGDQLAEEDVAPNVHNVLLVATKGIAADTHQSHLADPVFESPQGAASVDHDHAHQGNNWTKCWARQTTCWPSINGNITSSIHTCFSCQQVAKESMLQTVPPPINTGDTSSKTYQPTFVFMLARRFLWTLTDSLVGGNSCPFEVCSEYDSMNHAVCNYFVWLRMRASLNLIILMLVLHLAATSYFAFHSLGCWLWASFKFPTLPTRQGSCRVSSRENLEVLTRKTAPDGNTETENYAAELLELRNALGLTGLSPVHCQIMSISLDNHFDRYCQRTTWDVYTTEWSIAADAQDIQAYKLTLNILTRQTSQVALQTDKTLEEATQWEDWWHNPAPRAHSTSYSATRVAHW